MRVFEGDVEVELSEDEELTLHHAVPQLPELLVTFEWSAAFVEVPEGTEPEEWEEDGWIRVDRVN